MKYLYIFKLISGSDHKYQVYANNYDDAYHSFIRGCDKPYLYRLWARRKIFKF